MEHITLLRFAPSIACDTRGSAGTETLFHGGEYMNALFWQIMIFYGVLSLIVGPLIGNYFNSSNGAGYGYLVGSVISMFLWIQFGSKMTRMSG